MIDINDIKKGMALEIEGGIYQVVDFLHVKPGKGSAFMKTTLKNLRTGANIERTFNTTVKFEKAELERKNVQYLYSTGEAYVFMDNVTFDQFEIPNEIIGDKKNYLTEGLSVDILQYYGEILDIGLPEKIEMTIVEVEPAVKGNTSTGAQKNAYVETGMLVKVPLFIEQGEKIIVTTIDGKYYSRA